MDRPTSNLNVTHKNLNTNLGKSVHFTNYNTIVVNLITFLRLPTGGGICPHYFYSYLYSVIYWQSRGLGFEKLFLISAYALCALPCFKHDESVASVPVWENGKIKIFVRIRIVVSMVLNIEYFKIYNRLPDRKATIVYQNNNSTKLCRQC